LPKISVKPEDALSIYLSSGSIAPAADPASVPEGNDVIEVDLRKREVLM